MFRHQNFKIQLSHCYSHFHLFLRAILNSAPSKIYQLTLSWGFYLGKWPVDALKTIFDMILQHCHCVLSTGSRNVYSPSIHDPPPVPHCIYLSQTSWRTTTVKLSKLLSPALQEFLNYRHLIAKMLLTVSPIPTKVALCSMKPMLEAVIILLRFL